ncbi:MAG: DUF2834 domain-containing protein [Candidatus Binataceae bacterium]
MTKALAASHLMRPACAKFSRVKTVFPTVTTMKLKWTYLVLCVLGTVLPYWQLLPWVAANGPDLAAFFRDLFANRIGAFFGMDVFVSAAALLTFARAESRQLATRTFWLPLIAMLTVGVSLGLPLFLYMREVELARRPAQT